MSDDVAIKVDNVSKSFKLPHQKVGSIKHLVTNPLRAKRTYELQHALKNIDLEIKKGEFFGIVGRNGSGKSTLLKILAGIYQPTKGKVQVNGKLVPFIELGVGFNPELTGRENVYLNGALLGFSEKEIADMYDDIVEFAELEKFMDQKLKNYSSGMQVRLAFSMATRSQADILLIDEVLAVGDADFQRKCFNYFRSLKRNNKTVIFVSHDMEAIREYCDRCVLIDSTKIVYTGKPDVAAEKYTKQFNQNNINTKQIENNVRWGDGKARVSPLQVTLTPKEISIKSAVVFNDVMDNPIIGVLIKNASGSTVCGTNSKITKKKTGRREKGDRINISWSIPNIFSNDQYSIEVAVSHADGITQADWWHDAASFTINKLETTPHIVSPYISMDVS